MRDLKHLSVHQWIRSANPDSQQPISPIGFIFLKLPPPPFAVLLVITFNCIYLSHWRVPIRQLSKEPKPPKVDPKEAPRANFAELCHGADEEA